MLGLRARVPEAVPRGGRAPAPGGDARRAAQPDDGDLGQGTRSSSGLAVASQVPCRYCVIAHTEFAKLNGATDAEISEAIAMASLTRDMSTMLNGMQVDEAQFRKDVDKLVKSAGRRQEAAHHGRALTRPNDGESAEAALHAAPAVLRF